jgi:hypothetical protein
VSAATSQKCQTVTLHCYSVGTNEGRQRGDEGEYLAFRLNGYSGIGVRLAKGPRRLQTKGMRGVGKDDLLHVRKITR